MLKTIVALIFGESLSIYGELLIAKGNVYWWLLPMGIVSWVALLYGYWSGYKAGGIWAVTAVSIGSIVVIEPILVWMMFHEMPSRNALIGCVFGLLGIVFASIK